MLFIAVPMAGVVCGSNALAFGVCVCVCVATLSALFSYFLLHMKSAHFSWSHLLLCYPVLQPDLALDHLSDDFPLVAVCGRFWSSSC
jgi:hypothetical protein